MTASETPVLIIEDQDSDTPPHQTTMHEEDGEFTLSTSIIAGQERGDISPSGKNSYPFFEIKLKKISYF